MTPAFRNASLVLGLLAAGAAGLWLWRSTGSKGETDLVGVADRTEERPEEGADLTSSGGPSLTPAGPPAARPGNVTTVAPGARTPSGLDLSDPEQRRKHLAELLAQRPVPWDDVRHVVALMTEPLTPEARAFLLETLKVGDRNGALTALGGARDPALVADLFALMDDAAAPAGARRIAVMLLGRMPAGDRDEVVRQLEARLVTNGPADGDVLQALAERGGAEAMRAVTEFAARSVDASRMAQSLAGRFDLAQDPAAQAVLAEALGRTQTAAALEALVRIAGHPGASGVTSALVALDRDDRSQAVRVAVYEALAQVGSPEAVAHLLAVGRQPGQFGERAALALGVLGSGTPESGALLLDAYENAGTSPRPALLRSVLLEALGRTGQESALKPAVEALRDSDEQVRVSALRSLQGQRERARPHLAEVSALFVSGSAATRISVVNALASMGGAEALKQLEELAQRTDLGPNLKRTIDVAVNEVRSRGAPPIPGDG